MSVSEKSVLPTYVLLALTILFWGSAFVGIRAALDGYGPFELACFRFLVASLVLVPIAVVKKVRLPARADWGWIFLTGLCGIVLLHLALNYGELTITAGEASFLINIVPIFTALLAYVFLREPLTPRFLVGLGISFLGVSLIALNFTEGITLKTGSLAVVGAAVAQAFFFILQKHLLGRYKALEVVSYTIWSGTLLLLPFGIGLLTSIQLAPLEATMATVYLGIFPASIAHFCWASVLTHMRASKAAAFLYLVPVVALVLGFLWLRELPPLPSILGGLLALLGVAFTHAPRIR